MTPTPDNSESDQQQLLRIDLSSPTPPYEQIRQQLTGLIDAGQLQDGQRLPSVRQLAADLGLAVGTVMRAYRELDQAGLVQARRGQGTVVRIRGNQSDASARQESLSNAAAHLARVAATLGFNDDAAIAAARNALHQATVTAGS